MVTPAAWVRGARLLALVWLVLPGPAPASDAPAVTGVVTNVVPPPLSFFSLAPCRVVDTRSGGGPLVAGAERTLPLAGVCGIPAEAAAVSINVAVTQPTAAGNVRLYPAGSLPPAVSTINYAAGQTRTNNAIVGLGTAGALAARNQPAGSTHLIVDVNGYFAPPCAGLPSSNVGCEFYAVTLPNPHLEQSTFAFALAIVNPGLASATVNVSQGGVFVTTVVVAPSGSSVIPLPWVNSLSMAGVTTRANGAAYRVESDVPVAAYQFNPYASELAGALSGTNEASMLLPVKALNGSYRAAAWPTGLAATGHFAIVGTEDVTSVTVVAASVLVPGGGLTTNGGTVTLDRGDVLVATATSTVGVDVSGTQITSDKPVAVFGGHGCANVPIDAAYCDHLEEQLPPLELLGDQYVVPVPFNSTGTPRHFVQIQGTAANTSLTLEPPVLGAPSILDAGQSATFETTSAVRITATSPVIVTHFLEGGTRYGNAPASGDPSMTVATPTRQFRTRYDFLAAAIYPENWVTVMAPAGALISIDGVPIPAGSFTAVGASGFSVARVAVCGGGGVGCDGSHTAVGDQPFGLLVYGYGSQYTSYMYPGGTGVAR